MPKPSTQFGSEAFRVRADLVVEGAELWRELRVPLEATFEDLHHALQAVCGWEERHLYAFYASGGAQGEPRRLQLLEAPEGITGDPDWGRYRLDAWWGSGLRATRPEIVYIYDFGDGWRHRLRVTRESVSGATGWALLDCAGHFPPEDSGGPYVLEEFLERRVSDGQSRPGALAEDLAHLADWDPHAPLDPEQLQQHLVEATEPPWKDLEDLEDPEHLGPGEWSLRELIQPRRGDRELSLARRAWLVDVALSAQQHAPGRWVDSWILCSKRPNRRTCGAFVQLNPSEEASRAEWRCPACGDSGAIRGRAPDSRAVEAAKREPEAERIELRLPAEDYWALMTSDQPQHLDAGLLLAAEGLPGQGLVRLHLDRSELEDVFEWACGVVNHETSPTRRKRVERICELLQAAMD